MKPQITKLFVVVVLLFALLVAWTSRWTVLEARSLQNNPLNIHTLIAELRIKRGRILARDGTVLAKSVAQPGGTWGRTYPQGSLFAQSVGYSIVRLGADVGLERSRAVELRGIQSSFANILGPLGSKRAGDDVYTTLDPKAQQVALHDLAGRAGAVVAIVPSTGAIRAMIALPTYDDNHPQSPLPPGQSLYNTATQGGLPPGSTFKIVTAVAGIDSGRYTPSSVLNGSSPQTISGIPLSNDNNEQYPQVSLTDALTKSVNTVFAQVAETVGRPKMTEYMRRFGFYSVPPIDLPSGEVAISRPFSPLGHAYPPGSRNEDVGRIGIGQGGLRVTPLQMAMVTAAVANGGRLMAPRLTDRAVNQDGQTVETIQPQLMSTVMKPQTAADLTQMMLKVVEEGTGTPAQLGGISVAGKTGTASIGVTGSGLTEPWFVGFAPVNNPRIAVVVTIDKTQGGYGATVAAPIARDVIQTILSEKQ